MAFFPYSFWHNSRIPTQDLIAYYKLNNNGNDSYGSYHLSDNGTISYTTGKINTALVSTDKANYLSHVSNSDFQLLTNKTFAFWFQSNDTASEFFLSKFDDGGNAEYHFSKFVSTDPFSMIFTIYTATDVFNVTSDTILSLNDWNLCVGWVDFNNSTLYLQLNNGLPSSLGPVSPTFSSTPPFVGSAIFALGGTTAAGPEGASNKVDEVSIWNRILTESERNILWNNGNGRTYPFS